MLGYQRGFQQGLEDRLDVRRENTGGKALPRGQGIDTIEQLGWSGCFPVEASPLVGTA